LSYDIALSDLRYQQSYVVLLIYDYSLYELVNKSPPYLLGNLSNIGCENIFSTIKILEKYNI
ncbi:MAG: hypothetical protein K5906_00790, partial [Bacilli bacterium]|nr:hypothetical protein [Bacilli bacterium]